jgi:type VI secretion system protein ImpA
VRLHGAAGIRDGFQLLRRIVEECWDRVHPPIEEDDPEVRAGPFNWLDDKDRGCRFPVTLRLVPLIGRDKERYSWQQWKESQGPKATVTGAEIDKAINASSREQCALVVDDLTLAWQELDLLVNLLNAKMGSYTPGLGSVRESLRECRGLAEQVLQKKGGPKAATPTPAQNVSEAVPEVTNDSMVEKKMVTRADVFAKIAEAADVLKQLEPHSPIPYLLYRAVELGAQPFPELMKNLILNADVLKLMNRELGIKDTPEKK